MGRWFTSEHLRNNQISQRFIHIEIIWNNCNTTYARKQEMWKWLRQQNSLRLFHIWYHAFHWISIYLFFINKKYQKILNGGLVPKPSRNLYDLWIRESWGSDMNALARKFHIIYVVWMLLGFGVSTLGILMDSVYIDYIITITSNLIAVAPSTDHQRIYCIHFFWVTPSHTTAPLAYRFHVFFVDYFRWRWRVLRKTKSTGSQDNPCWWFVSTTTPTSKSQTYFELAA